MATHTRQHYVPRFLLEQWHTGADDRLSAFRWAHGRLIHKRYKAKSVARMEHLYSMNRHSSEPDVQLERDFLGPLVDEPAAVVHKKILSAGVRSLSEDDIRAWSRFLVSMLLRGPSMMQRMRERGRLVLGSDLEEGPEEYIEARGEDPAPTLRDWVEKNLPEAYDDLAVMTFPQLVSSELLNGVLLKARWATMRIDRSRFDLLVSDKPLLYVGAFDRSFLVTLPLAPRVAFLVFNEGETWERVVRGGHESLARAMNLAATDAEAYVYATDAKQEAFVRKHLPTK